MKVLAIAINTFKETIRDKILYNLLFFALLMIGSSYLLSELSLTDHQKIIVDVGLAAISIFGVMMSIFIGIGLVSKEIEKKTVYTIIAKPISRHQFLIGKYFGLLITLLLNMVIMTFGQLIMMYLNKAPINLIYFQAVFFIFIELSFITAIAILFSTFTTATLSAILTLFLFIIGHLTKYLEYFVKRSKSDFIKGFFKVLYYFLPNLENFNLKSYVTYNISIEPSYFFFAILYGVLYISAILTLAIIIFSRRDFK